MRLLILHRYLWPENLSLYPEMLKDIVQYHCESGDDVAVVTACALDVCSQALRDTWAKKYGVELFEVRLRYDRGQPPLARIVNAVSLCAAFRRAFKKFNPDIVLASSYPPIISASYVRRLCRLRRKSYIYYCQDIFPENLSLIRPKPRYLTRLLESIDRRNVEGAALTITLSTDMKAALLRRPGAAGRIECLNNYIPASREDVEDHERQKRTRPQPVFIYAGNMGPLQDLTTLVRGVRNARQMSKHISFCVQLMGSGMELENLKAIAARDNIADITFLPFRPRHEAQRAIVSADVGIVACAPGLSAVAFPSKIMSYLSAGLPVLMIADASSELESILAENQLGLCASAGDPADVGRKIIELSSRICGGYYDRNRIRQVSEKLFGMSRYFRKYDAAIRTVKRAINGSEADN